MEHTNKIAVKILSDEFHDYAHNPDIRWHYNSQYKMLLKAIESSGSVCEHQTEKYGKCLKCGEQIFNKNYDNVNTLREWINLEITERRDYTASKM